MYLGDFRVNSTVRVPWSSNGSSGQSITRATNGSIRIYKNNSTTERSSSAGITDTEDFDSLTGVHHVNIDTSDNTDSGFYAAGNDYYVVLAAATIDGQTVNHVLGFWSIENRSALMPATADRRLVVDAAGLGDSNVVKVGPTASGTAQTAKDLGAINVTNLNTLSGHDPGETIAGATDVMTANLTQINSTSVAGTGSRVADSFVAMLNIASPVFTVASVNQTGDSFARIGATGSGLTSLAPSATALSTAQWTSARAGYLDNINNANLASVPAFPSNFAALGINASGHLSRVTLVDTTTTNSDMIAAAAIRSALGLASANLDTQLAAIQSAANAIKLKTDSLTFTTSGKVDATLTLATDVAAAVANRIADHVLRRNSANARASSYGDALSFRSSLGAVNKLTNKIAASGANLVTHEEDDTTAFGTQAMTTDVDAEPVTALDTV